MKICLHRPYVTIPESVRTGPAIDFTFASAPTAHSATWTCKCGQPDCPDAKEKP